MGSNDRILYRATQRGERTLTRIGDELRRARLEAGVSQAAVGRVVRMSGAKISRIEAGKLTSLSVMDAALLGMAVGVDVVVKAYPGGARPRDAAHARRMQRILERVRPPLSYRTEVPLPNRSGAPEQRAWDAMLFGHGERTAIELEMRLYDIQAQTRRFFLKRQDDAPDRFLLVIADTDANRAVLRAYPEQFAELPRLGPASVFGMLSSGQHPPSGLVLV